MLSAEVEVPAMYRKATASSHHLQVFWVDNFRLQKKPERKWSGGRWMHPGHGIPITHYIKLDSNTRTETPFFLRKAKLFEASLNTH